MPEPANNQTIMDNPFYRMRYKKTLMKCISELAARTFWTDLEPEEKIMFLDSWKKMSRENSDISDADINLILDFDTLMEEATKEWVKRTENP